MITGEAQVSESPAGNRSRFLLVFFHVVLPHPVRVEIDGKAGLGCGHRTLKGNATLAYHVTPGFAAGTMALSIGLLCQ